MLHVTKVLCLVLAAAASSDAVGGALFLAKKSYINAINKAEAFIVSKHESIEQNLESAMESISSRLGQLELRDEDDDNHTHLESRRQYDIWREARYEQLNSIRDEAIDRFDNMRDEVETYVVMYKQNRIPEGEAVRFIEEDKLQLPNIVASVMFKYDAEGAIINEGPAI